MKQYNDESSQESIETSINTNIYISIGKPNYINQQPNNKFNTSTPNKDNYDERFKKLEDEISMIKSNKRSCFKNYENNIIYEFFIINYFYIFYNKYLIIF